MPESKARLISGAFTSTGDVRAENLDNISPGGLDSADVVTLIDSDYVSARSAAGGLDSAASLALITGGNAITVSSGVVNHDDTSSQASVNNSGSNFIQDITLDTYGHVTAITSAAAAGGDPYVNVNSTGTAASATGPDAIAIGETAVASGADGIAIGSGAYAHSQQDNISIGKNTMSGNTGSFNVAIGANAGLNSGSATSMVSIGAGAGNGSTANESTFIGYAAGMNVDNSANTAIGALSMQNGATSGEMNTAVGYQSSYYLTTARWTVIIGAEAGLNTSTGNGNTFIGAYAGRANQTGSTNTYLGYATGYQATGSSNVLIGYGCDPSSNASSNEVVVGYNLTGKGANIGFFGGNIGVYNQANNSTWSTTSDERIKTNVTDYTLGLDTLGQINVKTYNYRSDSDIAETYPELADSDGLVHENLPQDKTVVGLIAQELETVLPNSVTTRDNGFKSMDKDELFWVMLNSIKELKARVEALENN